MLTRTSTGRLAPWLALAALLGPAGAARGQDREDPFRSLFGEERRPAGDEASLPDDPVERAAVLLRVGRHAEAEALLRAARDEDPEDTTLLETLARLLIKTGRAAEADEVVAELVEVAPGLAAGQLLTGVLAESRGQLDPARQAYRNAWALARRAKDGVVFEVQVRLGLLLAESGARDEGARLLEEALQEYSRRPELKAGEFVWVARACRALDFFPAVKRQYAKRMPQYARQMLDQALLADATCVEAHVEAGALALSKYDTPAARKAFEKACELDPNHPDARVGLAQALLASFYAGEGKFGDAASNLQKALAVDPTHPDAHATLAAIAVTDGDTEGALQQVETGLSEHPGHVSLLAVRAAAQLLRADVAGFQATEAALLAARPGCARFYVELGELIQKKFRYAEARDMARKALAVDPGYHPALGLLGVNLTRTGDEEEGVRLLRQAFDQDPYNVFTFNSLELFDRVAKNYTTLEAPGFTVRVHKDEEKVSRRYVLALLEEAKRELGGKYGQLPERVLVEMFPDHNDFSARSVGLPGIPALGVCFGNTMTVISAGEREAFGPHCWGRTLWHEFTHVATLTRTGNRVPRWLTEGLSVYEEPRGRPSWVREYDADIITLMERGLLLPIATLDEGFTKPKYPGQVMMAYNQGGATCEFMAARWGFPKILELLDAYREGLTTPDAIRRTFAVGPEEFDALFRDWLERRYAAYAWLPPPSLEQRQALVDRVDQHPWDVAARGALARAYALHGQSADAEVQAGQALEQARAALGPWALASGVELLRGSWPGAAELTVARMAAIRAGAGDAYLALSVVAQRRQRPDLSRRHARRALALGTTDPVLAHTLIGMNYRAQNRARPAIAAFERAMRLSPPRADHHRVLNALWQSLGDEQQAMAQLRRVCELDSTDARARMAYAAWAKGRGDWSGVAAVLDDINLIDPFIPDAHLLLGEALLKTGADAPRLERALGEFEAAIELDAPYKAGALLGQARALVGLGRRAEALEKAKAALEADANLDEARKLRDELQAGQPAPPPGPPPAPPAPPAPAGEGR